MGIFIWACTYNHSWVSFPNYIMNSNLQYWGGGGGWKGIPTSIWHWYTKHHKFPPPPDSPDTSPPASLPLPMGCHNHWTTNIHAWEGERGGCPCHLALVISGLVWNVEQMGKGTNHSHYRTRVKENYEKNELAE